QARQSPQPRQHVPEAPRPTQEARPIQAKVNTPPPAQQPAPMQQPAPAPAPMQPRRQPMPVSRPTPSPSPAFASTPLSQPISQIGKPIGSSSRGVRGPRAASPAGGGVPFPGETSPDRESMRRLLMWKEILDPPLALRRYDDHQ